MPITLLNGSYKILYTDLALCIKHILPKIEGLAQTWFSRGHFNHGDDIIVLGGTK